MTRTVLDMEVEGVRPRERYMDTIRRDIKKNLLDNSSEEEWALTAQTGEWQHPGRPTDVEEP